MALLSFVVGPIWAAEPLAAPGPAIVRGENDAAWQPLFAALAAKGAIRATFTERREFAVRKRPVVVEGEMRLLPEHGLSLQYGERTVIIDARGMLLRDARGRTRVVKPDDRAPAVGTLLLPVLRFDLPELEKRFTIHGARADDAWRLDFTPRASDDVGIVVFGTAESVERIELRPKEGLHVEITLHDVQTGLTFTDAEVKRYFR